MTRLAEALERSAPKLQPFTVNIGQRGAPRISFGCMARSSVEAFNEHVDLCAENERCEIVPLRSEPFQVKVARHQLAEVQLRAVHARAEDADPVDAIRRAGL